MMGTLYGEHPYICYYTIIWPVLEVANYDNP